MVVQFYCTCSSTPEMPANVEPLGLMLMLSYVPLNELVLCHVFQLHKAYFKQCEEIKHLRQTIQSKDKRIETLEKELVQLKKMLISL